MMLVDEENAVFPSLRTNKLVEVALRGERER